MGVRGTVLCPPSAFLCCYNDSIAFKFALPLFIIIIIIILVRDTTSTRYFSLHFPPHIHEELSVLFCSMNTDQSELTAHPHYVSSGTTSVVNRLS
jgi:hypothetical protein